MLLGGNVLRFGEWIGCGGKPGAMGDTALRPLLSLHRQHLGAKPDMRSPGTEVQRSPTCPKPKTFWTVRP